MLFRRKISRTIYSQNIWGRSDDTYSRNIFPSYILISFLVFSDFMNISKIIFEELNSSFLGQNTVANLHIYVTMKKVRFSLSFFIQKFRNCCFLKTTPPKNNNLFFYIWNNIFDRQNFRLENKVRVFFFLFCFVFSTLFRQNNCIIHLKHPLTFRIAWGLRCSPLVSALDMTLNNLMGRFQ